MYLKYNSALGPPYQILIDTNFINFSIQNKLDVFKSMMDCLLAKCSLRVQVYASFSCCVFRHSHHHGLCACGVGEAGCQVQGCAKVSCPNLARICSLSALRCRIAKDPRFERLPCQHKGTYADDCLVRRVTMVRSCCMPCSC